MRNINGLYIPGDYVDVLQNEQYKKTIATIVQIAQDINEEEGNHFPLAAFEYGALSLLKDAAKDEDLGSLIPD